MARKKARTYQELVKNWLKYNHYSQCKVKRHDNGLLHITVPYNFGWKSLDYIELKSVQHELYRNDILIIKVSFLDGDKYVRINAIDEDSYETYLRVREMTHIDQKYYSPSSGCIEGSFVTGRSRKHAAIELGCYI